MSHVVEQGGERHEGKLLALGRRQAGQRTGALQEPQGALGQVVDAQGVEEARVDRARIYEVREAELLDAPQALELRAVDQGGRPWTQADVAPQGVTDRAGSDHPGAPVSPSAPRPSPAGGCPPGTATFPPQ